MQSIKEKLNKIKEIWSITNQVGGSVIQNNRFFNLIIIILVALSSFGLGRLSLLEENQPPIEIINQNLASIGLSLISSTVGKSASPVGKYVASKSSKIYHAPWCSGAQRIKEENKIWFSSKEEAEASGRTPASNCKGI